MEEIKMVTDILSENDLETFQSYAEWFGGRVNVDSTKPITEILSHWLDAKKNFLLPLFGNQTILEKEVCFTEPEDDTMDRVRDFLGNDYENFKVLEFLKTRIENEYGKAYISYASRIESGISEAKAKMSSDIWGVFNSFRNSYSMYTYNEFPFSVPDAVFNDVKIKIVRGTKPMKILHKICVAYGIEDKYYEDFRIKISQILNVRKVTGTLCLSINPMDYATMSDNNCGWDSCMSWINDGDYRAGTLGMLNSKVAVVGYLKSHTDGNYSGIKWNSKKWRELFYVDQNFMIGNKGYPYLHSELEEACLSWMKELAGKNLGLTHYGNMRKFASRPDDYEVVYLEDKDINITMESDIMYSDWFSHMSDPSSMFINENLPNGEEIDLEFSGNAHCLICGESYWDQGHLECCNCGGGHICEHCGETIYADQDMCEFDGLYYHSDCYSELYTNCDWCDEDYYYEDLKHIRSAEGVSPIWGYDWEKDRLEDNCCYLHNNICEDCLGELLDKDCLTKTNFGEYEFKPDKVKENLDLYVRLFDFGRETERRIRQIVGAVEEEKAPC